MAFDKRASEIWRDFASSPNELSGPWLPPKPDVRAWAGEVESLLETLLGSTGVTPSLIAPPIVSFDKPLVYDNFGASGPLATLYVPRTVYVRGSGTVISKTDMGAPSAFDPEYFALTVVGTSLNTVYIDLDDATNPVKIVAWPTLPPTNRPTRIILVAQVRNGVAQSSHTLLNAEELTRDTVFFTRPILADYEVILFPPFYHYRGDAGFTLYTPVDGSLYWEFPLNTASNEARYFFSLKEALAGNTPIIRSNTTAKPVLSGGRAFVEIAVVNARTVKSDFAVSQCEAENQFLRGRTPDTAELFDPGTNTTVSNVTNADLIALGFKRAVSGPSAFYGSPLPRGVPTIGRCFVRAYVETDTNNQFVAPSFYTVSGGNSLLGGVELYLEKKLNARAAIYSRIGFYNLDVAPDLVRVGVFNLPGAPAMKITGAQAYYGPMTDPAIRRGSYPETFDGAPLHGSTLYSIQGRPLPIFVDAMTPDRKIAPSGRAVITSTNPAGSPVSSVHAGAFTPDPALSPFTLTVSDEGDAAIRYSTTVAQKIAPPSVSGSPAILFIGDSITNRSLASQTNSVLRAGTALTPNLIGTMSHQGVLGEGREGWAFRHYINADPAYPPVPVGQEAVYLARPATGTGADSRHGYNPFIRLATSAEIAANDTRIRNGYIFDLSFYLTRFGLAVPAYIPLNLGTNDLNQQNSPTSVSDIASALAIMLPACLAVSSKVRVGLSLYNIPRSNISLRKWREEQVPAIEAMKQAATSIGGGRVDITSLWTVMSPDSGWETAAQAANAGNGRARIGDELHPIEPNRTLMAEKLAAWVACCAAGLSNIEGSALSPPPLSKAYSDAKWAADGRTLQIGYRFDGGVDVFDTVPSINSEWLWGDLCEDGVSVFRGVRLDGTSYPGGVGDSATAVSAWTNGAEVVAQKNGRRIPLTFNTPAGTVNVSPTATATKATYLIDNGTTVTTYEEDLTCTTSLVPTVTRLFHIMGFGQSNRDGVGSPKVHGTPVNPGRAVMFNAGDKVRGPLATDEAETPLSRDRILSIVDAYEIASSESPSMGFVWGITQPGRLAATDGALISSHAMGGQPFSAIRKGGTRPNIWNNLMIAQKRARIMAAVNGLIYVPFLHVTHGEADRAALPGVYGANMMTLWNDCLADFGAATKIVMSQMGAFTAYGLTTSEVPFDQLNIALANPDKFGCSGPQFHLPRNVNDGIHIINQARLGSYDQRTADKMLKGLDARPMHCTGAVRTSSTVYRLPMYVPVGNLTLDTTKVSNPGNYGITWNQTGGTARTISSVAISGNDIIVTLSGDPGAFTSAYIGIADRGIADAHGGPTTGARNNFRDQAADLDIDGIPMENWASHQRVNAPITIS